MKQRRFLSILLTGGLILGTLAGCVPGSGSGTSKNETQEAPKEEAAQEPVQEQETETAGASAAEENTTSGETQESSYLPLCDPGSETLSILTYQNWHASAYYDSEEGLAIENEIEKITGVNIDWECVGSGDYNTVAQTRLASGSELPDIIRIPNGTTGLADYSSQGLLVNIKDYSDIPDPAA